MFLRVRLLRLKQLLLHNWLSLKPSQQPLQRKVWARIPLSIWNEIAVHVFYFFLVGGGVGGGVLTIMRGRYFLKFHLSW